jgi:hypothetical protein
MIKIVYPKTEYGYRKAVHSLFEKKALLSLLIHSFYVPLDIIYVMKSDDYVEIWNTLLEEDYFNEEDVPRLLMTRQNYDEVINGWNANIGNPKQYVVLSQDDSGWIRLEAKNELSADDLASIEEDRKVYQEWEENRQKRANANSVIKFFRSLQYDIRSFLIKTYKKIREFFEELF